MALEPLEAKWRDFGWSAKTINGHNIQEIYEALSTVPFENSKPSCIIANTIKGKGLPFLEGRADSHMTTLDEAKYNEGLKILEDQKI
jgi:transketolase